MTDGEIRSADDFRSAVSLYEDTIRLGADADEVWAELSAGDHRFLPGVSVDWVTTPPHGVGTLRVMNFGPVHLRCRYYAWDESSRSKALYLENPPLGTHELIEEFHLTPDGSESLLKYRIAIIPRRMIRPILPLLSAYVRFVMRSWHLRFIKRRFQNPAPGIAC